MVARLQLRRFITAAAVWLGGGTGVLKFGEIAVNPVRRDIAVGDSDGTARFLLAIRPYSTTSHYAIGDYTSQGGVIYKCKTAIVAPEAFTVAKWDQVVWTTTELAAAYAVAGHNHDASYAAIGHNHDASYAAIGHNHDASYAAIGHNHDASYAAIAHSHDATYVRLTGSTSSGTQTFAGAPSIVTTGKVSVGAGSSPAAHHHVRDSLAGEVASMVQNTGAGPAMNRHAALARAGWWGLLGGAAGWALFDDTNLRTIFGADQGMTVGSPTGGDKGNGTLNAQGGLWDNNVRVATQTYADAAAAAALASAVVVIGKVSQSNQVSITFTPIPGTYRAITVRGRIIPLTDNVTITLRFLRADGGVVATVTSGAIGNDATAGGSRWALDGFDIQAATHKVISGYVVDHTGAMTAVANKGTDTAAITQVQAVASAGNVSGDIEVMGVLA